MLLFSFGNLFTLFIQKPIPKIIKGDQIFLAIQYKYLYPLEKKRKKAKRGNKIITGKAPRV